MELDQINFGLNNKMIPSDHLDSYIEAAKTFIPYN